MNSRVKGNVTNFRGNRFANSDGEGEMEEDRQTKRYILVIINVNG